MRMFALTKVVVCLLGTWGMLGVGTATARAEFVTNGWVKPSSPQNPAGRRPNRSYEVYSVRLTAGVTYTIDLTSNQVDPYLILVGPNGLTLEDDDSGGNLNARMVFTPQQTGNYLIYCTTFSPGEQGLFHLKVRP